MEILQNFIYPTDPEFGSFEKYIRTDGSVYYQEGKLFLQKFSSAEFDTYYNALSIPLWHKRVGLNSVSLNLKGKGKVVVELWKISRKRLDVGDFGYPTLMISSIEVSLSSKATKIDLNIDDEDLSTSLVYPRIVSLTNSEISDLSWQTSEKKRRDVKLGISITHFNRKDYVIPAIKRIKTKLLDIKEWKDNIDFTVIDNSQNITAKESMGVNVIPNENTGGSGGFTRGLIHYKNDTDATHVLFMDDDASLEIESIKRAYQILSFAKNDNASVGAALFYDDSPSTLIERGASLNNSWVNPLLHNKIMIKPENVLTSELSDPGSRAYMGWWFAAFPIKYANKFTPPYFVRGDDSSFSQLNDFDIIYANGIAAYAESFLTKVSPMVTYLESRNAFIVNAIFTNHKFEAFKVYLRTYLHQLMSGRYEYLKVLSLSLKDFNRITAKKFVKDINFKEKLNEINKLTPNHRLKEIDIDKLNIVHVDINDEGKLHKIFRLLTFNRSFLPMNSKQTVYQDFIYRGKFREIAGFKHILYYDKKTQKGFVVKISRLKTLGYLVRLFGQLVTFTFKYPLARRRLLKNLNYLTSQEMWNEILKLKSGEEN